VNGNTTIIDVNQSLVEIIRELLEIARRTVQAEGTHLPTAILHNMEGMYPIVLPFKNVEQKQALVDYVKKQAVETHCFAVTTITEAKIVDSRTGSEQECLVLATAVQGGQVYTVVQHFSKNKDMGGMIEFGEVLEGDNATCPGQMVILPEWEEEVSH
jgi:hypothetical protein